MPHDRPQQTDGLPAPAYDAAYWDERYGATPSVWGAEPNRWVAHQAADLVPGRALDLACGEGRNALWLASRGWQVIAVDFARVALEKGRAVSPPAARIEWVVADATDYVPAEPVDLALLCYLQVPSPERRAAVTGAARALSPGGVLLVIAHDSRNRTEGTGGPRNPAVLCTAADLTDDLDGTGLVIEHAGESRRPVDGAERPAIDCVLRARAPGSPDSPAS